VMWASLLAVAFARRLGAPLEAPAEAIDLFSWLPANEVFAVCDQTMDYALAATREGESPVDSLEMTCLKHLAEAKKRIDADVDAMKVMDECEAFSKWAAASDPDTACVQLAEAHAKSVGDGDMETYSPEHPELVVRFCKGVKALALTVAVCEDHPALEVPTHPPPPPALGNEDSRWSGHSQIGNATFGSTEPQTLPDCELGNELDCNYAHDALSGTGTLSPPGHIANF